MVPEHSDKWQVLADQVRVTIHEARVNVSGVKGYTDLLLKGAAGKLSEQQRDWCEIIHENMEALTFKLTDFEIFAEPLWRESEKGFIGSEYSDKRQVLANQVKEMIHKVRVIVSTADRYVDLLSKGTAGKLSEQQRDWCKVICKNMEALSFELTDFEMFSELFWEENEDQAEVNPGALIQCAISKLKDEVKRREVTILVGDGGLDLVMQGNEQKLLRALLVPIELALFSTHRGGHIVVTVEKSKGNAIIRISSNDTYGLKRSMGPNTPISPDFPELRAGMRVVEQIAAHYGGSSWTEQQSGVENAFVLSLPLLPAR